MYHVTYLHCGQLLTFKLERLARSLQLNAMSLNLKAVQSTGEYGSISALSPLRSVSSLRLRFEVWRMTVPMPSAHVCAHRVLA